MCTNCLPSIKYWIYLHIPTNLQLQKMMSWKLISFLVSFFFFNVKNLVSNDL